MKRPTNYHQTRQVFRSFQASAQRRPLKKDKPKTIGERIVSRIKNIFKRNKKVA